MRRERSVLGREVSLLLQRSFITEGSVGLSISIYTQKLQASKSNLDRLRKLQKCLETRVSTCLLCHVWLTALWCGEGDQQQWPHTGWSGPDHWGEHRQQNFSRTGRVGGSASKMGFYFLRNLSRNLTNRVHEKDLMTRMMWRRGRNSHACNTVAASWRHWSSREMEVVPGRVSWRLKCQQAPPFPVRLKRVRRSAPEHHPSSAGQGGTGGLRPRPPGYFSVR